MNLDEFFTKHSEHYNIVEMEIYKKFASEVVIKGNTILIPKEACNRFIQETKNYPMAVSGIDVFRMNEKGNENIEIADFSTPLDESWDKYKDSTLQESLDFLEVIEESQDIF